jgi:hypothetical protein
MARICDIKMLINIAVIVFTCMVHMLIGENYYGHINQHFIIKYARRIYLSGSLLYKQTI